MSLPSVTDPPTIRTVPALDAPVASGLRARFAWRLLGLAGWRVVLAQPVPPKCVIVFYPHTANWDFPIGLCAKWIVGINFRGVVYGCHAFVPMLIRQKGGYFLNMASSAGLFALPSPTSAVTGVFLI